MILNLILILIQSLILICSALAGVIPSACYPIGSSQLGATVKFYGDKVSYSQQDFLLDGYQNNGLIKT